MNRQARMAVAAAVSLSYLGITSALQAQSRKTTREKATMHQELRKPSDNRVVVRIGDKAFTVDLYDNATAHDLMPRLPLRLQASNYPGYDEKVLRLPKPLSMQGAPRGDEPEIPEVGYYQPGQWIALYYGPIGYWPGKVPLGRIHATPDELRAIPDGASVAIKQTD